MKDRLRRAWEAGSDRELFGEDQSLARSCAGRLVSALAFIVVILCIGLWITAFLLLKDQVFSSSLTGNVLTDLTCITFFGGLILAIFVGAMAGNFLRRSFWHWLVKREPASRQ